MGSTALLLQPDTNDVLRVRERSGEYSYWLSEEFVTGRFGVLEINLRTRFRKDYRKTVSVAKQDKDLLPDTGADWRYMKKDGRFYYAHSNIPVKYRAELEDAEALYNAAKSKVKEYKVQSLTDVIRDYVAANKSGFFRHYAAYKSTHIERLGAACAALQLCVEMANDNGGITCAWCMQYGAALEQIDLAYLPVNWRRLKEKADLVKAGNAVHEVVDLPRANNQNRRVLHDMEVEAWVMQMRSYGANYTNAHIYRKVALLCDLCGKKMPSESAIKEILAQPETKFLTAAGRHGERGRKGANYRTHTPVEIALFAGDCWQIDGTRVNFLPWKNPTTGREEHLYMVAVRDVHSGAILGVEYCLNEDRWVYLSALEMAVKNAGYLPYELAVDRFPGHNTEEWQLVEKRLETLAGVKVSYKHKATGKAQLERWFGTLQTVFFQDSAYYYGEGIRSNREYAHRSPEHLKAVSKTARKEWNFDVAVAEANWCIKTYNETRLSTYSRKHKTVDASPLELHTRSDKKNVCQAPVHHRALLFGLAKEVQIRNGMIRTEIQKQEYFYNVPYEVAKGHTKVLMAYSLTDLNEVFLFEAGQQKEYAPVSIGVATTQQRIQVFGPDADMKGLAQHQARLRKMEDQRQADLEAATSGASPVHLLLGGLSRKGEQELAESTFMMDEVFAQTPGKVIDQITDQLPATTDEDIDFERYVLNRM